MESMLNELRAGWHVSITSNADGWTLTITSRGGTSHAYHSRDLERIVRAAWAGERGGIL